MRVNYVNDFLMYVSMSILLIHFKFLYYFIFLWSAGIGGADVTNPTWQIRELSVQVIWLTLELLCLFKVSLLGDEDDDVGDCNHGGNS